MIRDKIKKIRLANGYTQEEMAILCGVDRSTYTYYETGKCEIPVKALIVASSAFGIAVEWFLSTDEEKRSKVNKAPTDTLHSCDMFLPDTLVENYEEEEPIETENNDPNRLTGEERIMLARYRIIKDTEYKTEVDEYMKKLVEEELSKI